MSSYWSPPFTLELEELENVMERHTEAALEAVKQDGEATRYEEDFLYAKISHPNSVGMKFNSCYLYIMTKPQ